MVFISVVQMSVEDIKAGISEWDTAELIYKLAPKLKELVIRAERKR